MADTPPEFEVLEHDVQATRPSTDASLIIQLMVGLVGTVATAFAVGPLEGTKLDYLWGIVNDRGVIQYFTLFMFWMIVGMLVLKTRIIRKQMKVIIAGPVDPSLNLEEDEVVNDMRKEVHGAKAYSWSIILSRIDRTLALWLHSKDVGRISTWSTSESDRDAMASNSSYALAGVLIWAIPILGFIGTVMGLGKAVSEFGAFLEGSAGLDEIKGAISGVTGGLGVAFDTTLLSLVLSVFAMFPMASIQRREDGMYVEIDNYIEDVLISRFPHPEQQPIVLDNLEESMEAAFRRYIPDPDRYEEVFTRAIDRAAQTVEERFGDLAKGYESSLHDLSERLASGLSAVGDGLTESMKTVASEIKGQEEAFLEARSDLSEREAERFKELVGNLDQAATGALDQYRDALASIEKSSGAHAERTQAAAGALNERLGEVTRMASGIQDMLKIEESLEKSLQGISSTNEFQGTLQDLREHLKTTTDFCNRMSKPKKITLREEVVS